MIFIVHQTAGEMAKKGIFERRTFSKSGGELFEKDKMTLGKLLLLAVIIGYLKKTHDKAA